MLHLSTYNLEHIHDFSPGSVQTLFSPLTAFRLQHDMRRLSPLSRHLRLRPAPCHHRVYSTTPPTTLTTKRPSRPRSPSSHDSLATFELHAVTTNLSKTSTVYIGTRYEYQVAASLARLGFTLERTGGASDLGIDLRGSWTVAGHTLPVLVQCKALAAGPAQVRELEGVGRPVGYRGAMVLLAAKGKATRGVREAVQRSRVAMGFVSVTAEGRVVQMVWNRAAEEAGLEGVGVGTRFGGDGGEEVVLTLQGKAVKDCKG